ncbi:hypothetical protein HK102_010190 [Quaeritorhiza haematococci]|nr:hypothetical protein HK102_010190 [Quaeritorhiza haematococci]
MTVGDLETIWDSFKEASKVYTPANATSMSAVDLFDSDGASVVFVPTAGGGSDHRSILEFFKAYSATADAFVEEKVISRVVGRHKLVEESILTLVHQQAMDWLLPEVKSTGRRLVVPLVHVVSFNEESKITSMHVYWDQASLLKQIGILPTSLYCKANGQETVLPVLGVKIADRLIGSASVANPLKKAVQERPMAGMTSAQANNLETPSKRNKAAQPLHAVIPQGDDLPRPLSARRAQEAAASVWPGGDGTPTEPKLEMPTKSNGSRRPVSKIFFDGSEDAESAPVRPSTRVHQPSGGHAHNIFAQDEAPVPVKTSIPIDPRRFQTQINIFDGETAPEPAQPKKVVLPPQTTTPDSPSPSRKKTGRKIVDNRTNESHFSFTSEETPASGAASPPRTYKKMGSYHNNSQVSIGFTDDAPLPVHTSRKMFTGSNSSQISLGSSDSLPEKVAATPIQAPTPAPAPVEEVIPVAVSPEPVSRPTTSWDDVPVGGRKNLRDPNATSDEPKQRPSSRVLGPPGGKTSFTFG